MADKVMGSYMIELKPMIDKSKWEKATGDIGSAINASKISHKEWEKMQGEIADNVKRISKLKGEQQRLEKLRDELKYKTDTYSKLQVDRIDKLLKGDETKGEDGITKDIESLAAETAFKKKYMESFSGEIEEQKKTLQDSISDFSGKIRIVSDGLKKLYDVFKRAIQKSIEIADEVSEASNKLNAYGSFGSMNTRDVMSRYGVTSVRANAMTNALSMMGMSESDIGRMSQAQKKTYNELIEYYEKSVNRIDTDKLKNLYKITDDYQTAISKWKIGLETNKLKFFAESKSLDRLLGSLEKFFDSTIKFLDNSAVKFFLNTFIEFLSSLVDIASDILGIFGGNTTNITTSNSNNTSTNNYYIYGSNYANNNNLARTIALEQQTGGIG